jgi:hypothetical protein
VSACRFDSHSVTEINRHRRSFSGTPKLQRNHLEGKNFFCGTAGGTSDFRGLPIV